jgi:hypothetical protein
MLSKAHIAKAYKTRTHQIREQHNTHTQKGHEGAPSGDVSTKLTVVPLLPSRNMAVGKVTIALLLAQLTLL